MWNLVSGFGFNDSGRPDPNALDWLRAGHVTFHFRYVIFEIKNLVEFQMPIHSIPEFSPVPFSFFPSSVPLLQFGKGSGIWYLVSDI